MRFIKSGINLDFIGKRKVAFIFSLALILISLASLVIHKGLKTGIDFAGGTIIQIKFPADVAIDDIKSGLENVGLSGSTVQAFGEAASNEYLIRTDVAEEQKGFEDKLTSSLTTATGQPADIRRMEMVGPQVGKDLRDKALFAIFFSLLFITVYISGRFEHKWTVSFIVAATLMGAVYVLALFSVSVVILIVAALVVTLVLFWFLELKYAMGAIVALIHDVTITVGIFSIMGKEFTLPIIAAVLTIIGYSLNDTIIVFDRIRENQQKFQRNPLEKNINQSINETLSRTILTSLTTLMVVVTLFLLGGGIIHDFAFAIMVGVLIGTYSSVYVASPILIAWQKRA